MFKFVGYNLCMEKRTKILSLFIVFLFALNVFSLTGILDVKSVAVSGSAIENFYSAVSVPSDIIGNMMSQKAQNKTSTNETKSKDNNCFKITDYAVVATVVFTMMLAGFVLCRGRILTEYFTKLINYPLKIPFREEIFLLLLTKILFNVRPRGGDIYAYGYAVKKACVD